MLAILDILVSIADIVSLALLLWIVQLYLQPGNLANASRYLPAWLASMDSIVIIAAFCAFFCIKNFLASWINRSQYRFIARVAVRISANNLASYQQGSFEEFINTDSSVHIRRICFQPFEFCQYILSGIQQILTQSVLILLTIIAIVLFNAGLFLLLFLVLLPPVIIVFYFIKKKLIKARLKIRSSNEKSFQYVLDALKGYVEGNIYKKNDFFLGRFVNQRHQFSTHLFNSLSLQTIPSRIIETFAVLGLFILILIAGRSDNQTLLTIGAFMAAAYKIIPGIVKIINSGGQIKAYEFSITDLVQTKKTDYDKIVLAGISSIQLKNIHFQYDQQIVLNNFSLCINQGDFVGISGASGIGKTTIFNLLLGFHAPCDGEIIVNGWNAGKEQLKTHWPHIAYVRQQPFFIYDTILRNITLEEDGHDAAALDHALTVSGLDKFISTFPEGINKVITENGKNISGGQQQRITIARALYKKADLILLDEPFNELDEESEKGLLAHFRELAAKGKMVVMITHDKRNLSWCNKIISLDDQ